MYSLFSRKNRSFSKFKKEYSNDTNYCWCICRYWGPVKNCKLSLPTGKIVYLFKDSKADINRKFKGDEQFFEIRTFLFFDENFIGDDAFHLCSIQPLHYDTGIYCEKVEAIYRIRDVRYQQFNEEGLEACPYTCAYTKGEKFRKVPTLKWCALLQYHRLNEGIKFALLDRTFQYYKGNVREKAFIPLVPKSVLQEIHTFENTCILHSSKYRKFYNNRLTSRLPCPSPCSNTCSLKTRKVLPEILFAHHEWLAKCWHNNTPLFLVVPDQCLGQHLIKKGVHLNRLFLKDELDKMVDDHEEEITLLSEDNYLRDKHLIGDPKMYGVVKETDYVVVNPLHPRDEVVVAVDLNRIFRNFLNSRLLMIIPNLEGGEREILEIDFERFLVLISKMPHASGATF